MEKSGIKTSELWVAVSTILGYLAVSLAGVDLSDELGEVGAALPGLVAAIYAIVRAWVKVREGQTRATRPKGSDS